MNSLLFLCAVLAVSVPDDPKLDGPMHVERELAVKLELTLTETITGYSVAPEKWLVAAANLPGYEAQTVHSAAFYIPSDPQVKAARFKDKGGLGQTYLSVVFPHPTTRPVTAQAIYQVSLYKRKLVEGASPEKPFPLGNAKLYYTASHPWLDMGEAEFKTWLREEKLQKSSGETDLKFAWRVFKEIATFFKYDPDAEGLSPLSTIAAKSSNTLGLANLYLAILRTSDVPCRFVVGRPLANLKDQENALGDSRFDERTTDVWVEFWTDDIGWIPTDIVHAVGHHEPSDFFGKTEGDFVAFHFDMIQFEKGAYSFLERMDWTKSEGVEAGAVIKRKIELRKL